MRPYARVRKLTEEEYQELKRWESSRTMGVSKVRRAKIVLLSHRGLLVQEIAEKLELHHQSVRKWVNRFSKLGIPGLEEGPRHGRPHIYKAEHVSTIIQTALTKPDTLGLPFSAWTLNRLTTYLREKKGIAMSRSRMSKIFRNEGLRWRQQEGWFGQRVDPDFAQKRGSSSSSTPTRPSTASSSA